jgi:hypothetical protein
MQPLGKRVDVVDHRAQHREVRAHRGLCAFARAPQAVQDRKKSSGARLRRMRIASFMTFSSIQITFE